MRRRTAANTLNSKCDSLLIPVLLVQFLFLFGSAGCWLFRDTGDVCSSDEECPIGDTCYQTASLRVCVPTGFAACLDAGVSRDQCIAALDSDQYDIGNTDADVDETADGQGDLSQDAATDVGSDPDDVSDAVEAVGDADDPSVDLQSDLEDAVDGDTPDAPCASLNRCVSRVVETCHPDSGAWSLWSVCESTERCLEGSCEPLPEEFGEDCVVPADCPDPDLQCLERLCRSRLDGAIGDECLGDADCADELLCTQSGYCQSGSPDEDCLFDTDCASRICGPTGLCQTGAEADPCTGDADCSFPRHCALIDGHCFDGSSGDPCDDHSQCAGSAPMCAGSTCRSDFVRVADGTFYMGSGASEWGRSADEQFHQVTLTRDFFVAKHEVTQEQWAALMGTAPSRNTGCVNCPVERVNWFEALLYANALSDAQGLERCYVLDECSGTPGSGCVGAEQACDGDYHCEIVDFVGLSCDGFRLPTEAEWEYAARAGTATAFYTGSVDEAHQFCEVPFHLTEAAYYCAHGVSGAQPTGGLAPNAFNLFDTLGNVREWVWDRHAAFVSGPVSDPLGAPSGRPVTRGGDWYHAAIVCRAADRFPLAPETRDDRVGLRLVRTAEPQ